MTAAQPQAWLVCYGCQRVDGPFSSYQEWEDSARRTGWWVGEEEVLCYSCSGYALL